MRSEIDSITIAYLFKNSPSSFQENAYALFLFALFNRDRLFICADLTEVEFLDGAGELSVTYSETMDTSDMYNQVAGSPSGQEMISPKRLVPELSDVTSKFS